jgi:hypothetical protein
LDGDPEELGLHVGHTVEVAGALSAEPSGGGPTTSVRVLKLATLTYISKTCQARKP